jgi:alcohol dehydrogenase
VLQQLPQAPVLIVGGNAKSIGLYAAGMAVALGSSQVDYLDTDRERLTIAERLGARAIEFKTSATWFRKGEPVHRGGYAISVEASGTSGGLSYALAALAKGGVCTACAFYLRRATPLPLWAMYMRSATLHVGVTHPRAHVPAVLDLIQHNGFDPSKLNPLLSTWDDAPRTLLERATKVIVQRPRLHPTRAA